jgi:hypothetical protein
VATDTVNLVSEDAHTFGQMMAGFGATSMMGGGMGGGAGGGGGSGGGGGGSSMLQQYMGGGGGGSGKPAQWQSGTESGVDWTSY